MRVVSSCWYEYCGFIYEIVLLVSHLINYPVYPLFWVISPAFSSSAWVGHTF